MPKEKTRKYTFRIPVRIMQVVRDRAVKHNRLTNAEVVRILDAYVSEQVDRDIQERIAQEFDDYEPTTTDPHLKETLESIILRYVARIEERKPPTASDLHNWLKRIPTTTIQSTLDSLAKTGQVQQIISSHATRYTTRPLGKLGPM